jgi:hypothetical protein
VDAAVVDGKLGNRVVLGEYEKQAEKLRDDAILRLHVLLIETQKK